MGEENQMNPKSQDDAKTLEETKAKELALIEKIEIARLSGDYDAAKTSLDALIRSLNARGIDTRGLEAAGGGGIDVAGLTAMVNDVSSKASAAGGKENQADLVAALGTLVPLPFQKGNEQDTSLSFTV